VGEQGGVTRPKTGHRWRFVVALLALFLIYSTGILLGLALVAVPVVALALGEPRIGFIVLGIAGVALLGAFRPRRGPREHVEDEWVCPVPRPDVDALVAGVAEKLGARMPEVRIVSLPGASMMHTGGVLGLGGRSVLRLSLPIVSMLNVGELRAIVAHELGHDIGWDGRIGLVMHSSALVLHRMRTNAERPRLTAWVAVPLGWLESWFVKVMRAQQRDRELLADRWSAAIAGADVAAEALHNTAVLDEALAVFFGHVVAQMVDKTHVLPVNLLDGLREYEGSRAWMEADAEATAAHAVEEHAFDTHPSRARRLEHFRRLGHAGAPDAESKRRLADPISEEAWSEWVVDAEDVRGIPWAEARACWPDVITWDSKRVQFLAPDLAWGSLPQLISEDAKRLALALRLDRSLVGYALDDLDERVHFALRRALASWVMRILAARGWSLRVRIGDPTSVGRQDDTFTPFTWLGDLLADGGPTDAARERLLTLAVDDDARVELTNDDRAFWDERMTSPFTALRSTEALGIRGPFHEVWIPRCCAVCLARPSHLVEVPIPTDRGTLYADVLSCEVHESSVRATVWGAWDGDDIVSVATNNEAFGRLLLACNGIDELPVVPAPAP